MTRYVGAHGIAQLLLWSSFYYLLPALSAQIVLETGWPVLHISTTYTLAFLVWALMAPIVGALVDAGHGAVVMRLGGSAGAAILLALSFASNEMVFRILVILLGACMSATLYDPCFAVMMRRLKSDGAHAVAGVTLIAGFATLLTFPSVIALSQLLGWQGSVLGFAALAVVGVMFLPAEGVAEARPPRGPMRLDIEKGPVLIALSFGLVMMAHAILLFLLPVALAGSQSVSDVGMLALAILGPAQIAGRIAWRSFGKALPARECALIMFVCLCFPATLLLLTGAAPVAVYVALTVQGACYGVHTILRPSLAQQYLDPARFGRGLGGIATVGVLMMAVGPLVGGLVWTFGGLSGLMLSVLLINAVALLLGLMLRGVAPRGATL